MASHIFSKMSKPFFPLPLSFKRVMRQNPDALAWFTKPEKAMKQRINDYVSQKQKESLKLME